MQANRRRTDRPRPRRATLAILVAAAATLGACGGEDDDDAPVEVIGSARLVDAPPAVEIEMRTVNRSVPLNAIARPAPEPAPMPEPEPGPAVAPEPVATIATDIEEVIIAPGADVADVEATADAVGARTTAPVEADDLIAETAVTPSVPDATTDNPPWNSIVSDWTGAAEALRREYGDLDADELLATRGDRGQVVSIMENRLGLDRAAAERALDDFARAHAGS